MIKIIHDGHRLNCKTTCGRARIKDEGTIYTGESKRVTCEECLRIMKTRKPSKGLLGKQFI